MEEYRRDLDDDDESDDPLYLRAKVQEARILCQTSKHSSAFAKLNEVCIRKGFIKKLDLSNNASEFFY